jgi:hypothetical protein
LIDDRHAKAGFNRPPVLREGRAERHGENHENAQGVEEKRFHAMAPSGVIVVRRLRRR